MTAEFSDLSHWQGTFKPSLYTDPEIGLKATDGSSVDPTYVQRVTVAHRKKIRVHHYDFGEIGDAATQARAFVAAVKPHWRDGDFATIDAEIAGFNGADAKIWQETVHSLEPSWQLEIYGGCYFLKGAGITPLYGALLWIAEYSSAIAFIPPGWDHADRWQYTSTASVPAIGGKSDRSRILDVAPKPTPKPKPPRPWSFLTRRALRRLRLAVPKHKGSVPAHGKAEAAEVIKVLQAKIK